LSKRRLLAYAFAGVLVAVGCGCGGGGGGGQGTPTIAALTISLPDNSHVAAGSVLHLTAEVLYTSGVRAIVEPEWATTGAVGTVATDGVYTAATAGTGSILATFEGFPTGISVTVIEVDPGALSGLAVTPAAYVDPMDVAIGTNPFFYLLADDAGSGQTLYVEADPGSWTALGDVGAINADTGQFIPTTEGSGSIDATGAGGQDAAALSISVTGPKVTVTGRVINNNGGAGIVGVSVAFLNGDGLEVGRMVSDATGKFSGQVSTTATHLYVDVVPPAYQPIFWYGGVYYWTGLPDRCKAPISAPYEGRDYGYIKLFHLDDLPPPPPGC
jgi:hypothetical protein